MVRAVFDTNILVSALLKPKGIEARVVALLAAGKVTLCLSPEVMAEYADVLTRHKFEFSPEAIQALFSTIDEVGVMCVPATRVTVSTDPDDNRFLECAEASQADYLVTGNKRHFPDSWGGTKIVNAREFLEQFRRGT